MVMIPANVKRVPANSICELISSDEISNKEYPIFTKGNALPHKAQHRDANTHTTIEFFNHLPLSIR
jgi:hypothetical protein